MPPRQRASERGGRPSKLKDDPNIPQADQEEVYDVHSIHDSSDESEPSTKRKPNGFKQNDKAAKTSAKKAEAIELDSDTSELQLVDEDEDLLDLEDVDVPQHPDTPDSSKAAPSDQPDDADEEDLEMENVELDRDASREDGLRDMYAAAYQQALERGDGENGDEDDQGDDEDTDTSKLPIYKNGKGQHRGVEISMGAKAKNQNERSELAKKRAETMPTARDRQNRISSHKLYVLSMLAFARIRNKWCNDDELRDFLATMAPDYMMTKLRAIHPKKVPEQRERMRMFESFLGELVKWWSSKFRMNPDMTSKAALRQPDLDIVAGIIPPPGRKIDGWIVESAADRDERHRRERRERIKKEKQEEVKTKKGKAKATQPEEAMTPAFKPLEITLFAPGTLIRPIFLSLLPPAEPISSSKDLLERAKAKSGSRETSAQLFCALCRSLGIPSRLVISPQPMPWSVGASKLANTAQPSPKVEKKKTKLKLPAKRGRFATKPVDELTSDEEYGSSRRGSSRAATPDSPMSLSDLSGIEELDGPPAPKVSPRKTLARKAVLGDAKSHSAAGSDVEAGDTSDRSTKSKSSAASEEDKPTDRDYRPSKWRNLDAPLKIVAKPKLRKHKPKVLKPTKVAGSDSEPVDLLAPPTMWVEVYSKPYQKWISVDPVRGIVRPAGNRLMEPSPTDRQNKLVYVVAFEEDGYARDVTARYTKTLNSRVARLRPPTRSKNEEDWWGKTARAIHRPQQLDRDAMEDLELEDNASKEPMPTSFAGFKDHPIYFLEKHLKRDQVVFPKNKVATFQGMPVYLRSNVLTLRSSRQWFNEGRIVKEGEEALKWVKSRGYTLANKRAQEQAKAEGRESPNEGLYALFQTELYKAPPIKDGVIPTNSFGNIDLFVPSMLPDGAAHIPHSGVAKVARKLRVPYAEAITGFEFRKHRGMPKITGIVVPEENEEMVLDAFWESQADAVERENAKRVERAVKHWKKLVNALRIKRRVREDYGTGEKGSVAKGGFVAEETAGQGGFVPEEGGGFVAEQGGFLQEKEGFMPDKDMDSPPTTKRPRGGGKGIVSLSSLAAEAETPEEPSSKRPRRAIRVKSLTQPTEEETPRRSTRARRVQYAEE